jgi:hypothetical protein
MIEQNIIEWLELGDSIQKLDLYNKKTLYLYIMNYLLSQYSNFSLAFYLLFYLLFFLQIIELNIIKIDITGDGILQAIKYLENFILFHKPCYNNYATYISFLIITLIFYTSFVLMTVSSMFLYIKKQRKNRFLNTTNSFLNQLNVYFFHGPAILIMCSRFFCHDGDSTYLCPFKGIWQITIATILKWNSTSRIRRCGELLN